MTLSEMRESLPDFAKDIKLNLPAVLSTEGAPGLSLEQIWLTALACSYATKSTALASSIEGEAQQHFSSDSWLIALPAAKGAATIMAMNNIYYRFTHLAEEQEFHSLPARLRMNIIGKPGVSKADFELMSLAVSAISGCGKCINAHIHELKKAGVSSEGIHSAVRIASVINATSQALAIQG